MSSKRVSSSSHLMILLINVFCLALAWDVSDGVVSWRGIFELHQAQLVVFAFVLFTVTFDLIYVRAFFR